MPGVDDSMLNSAELRGLLSECELLVCSTNGPDGWPHAVPLAFVVAEGDIWSWSFAHARKVRNLERDSRATLALELGDRYDEVRGAMLKTDATIHRDTERVKEMGLAIVDRREHGLTDELREMVVSQVPNRVALQFVMRASFTWDYRKVVT